MAIRIKEESTDKTVYEEVTEEAVQFTEESVTQEIERIDQQVTGLLEEKEVLEKKLADAKKL